MAVIDEFLARYRREFDFYDQAARLVSQLLEARLQAAGVRAIVTFRAKSAGRLEPKVRARASKKNYVTVEDIYVDIPDLAGVRIAHYFPAQREQVGRIINDALVVMQSKTFPDNTPSSYPKRFAGYSATHYRVRLRETTLVDTQKRYAEARVEVQVASVLMHAWAEVEHDLVYKPYQGVLVEDEYAILDELNGMVMAGEIALERLQRAGDARVASRGRGFANHYDLAAYLISTLRELAESDALQEGLGRVDLLYQLLVELQLATPEGLARYLSALHPDLDRRPVAEQIIDQLLSEDPARYQMYDALRIPQPTSTMALYATEPVAPDTHEAIGMFLSAWIELERLIRDLTPAGERERGPVMPTTRRIDALVDLGTEMRSSFERLRRMRNMVVHGVEALHPTDLRDAAHELDRIREVIAASRGVPA
jgi:ppGpp synthetase/RelA/SpoT-type nucleotidyltranferase